MGYSCCDKCTIVGHRCAGQPVFRRQGLERTNESFISKADPDQHVRVSPLVVPIDFIKLFHRTTCTMFAYVVHKCY